MQGSQVPVAAAKIASAAVSDNNSAPITPETGRGPSKQTVVGLSVLVPASAVLLAVAVGLLMWRRMTGHRSPLNGAVRPPGAGARTSLLITDIQDSTALWEALPDDVMDALKTHHVVVRQALAKHNGYESATEGDSFILSFHNPEDAVACTLSTAETWKWKPARCAECASAAEVWVAASFRSATNHAALLEMLGGGAACERGVRRGTLRPLCWVRSFWQAVRAGGGSGLAGAVAGSYGPPPRVSGAGVGAGWGDRAPVRRPDGRSWRRKAQAHLTAVARHGAGGGAAAGGGGGGACGQKVVELATTPPLVLGGLGGGGGARDANGPVAGRGGVEEEGPRGSTPQLSGGPFGRLSALSELGDDDDAMPPTTSNTWSASHHEGFLTRGSSCQIRDETEGSSGWRSALFGAVSRLRNRPPARMPQHPPSLSQQQQLYGQPVSSAISTMEKTNPLSGRTSFCGGAAGTAGISAATVAVAGGTGGCGSGGGPGLLLKDHIRAAWLVVESAQPYTSTCSPEPNIPCFLHHRTTDAGDTVHPSNGGEAGGGSGEAGGSSGVGVGELRDAGLPGLMALPAAWSGAHAGLQPAAGGDAAPLPTPAPAPTPARLQSHAARPSLRDVQRSLIAATAGIGVSYGSGCTAEAAPPLPVSGVAIRLAGSRVSPDGGALALEATGAAGTPPATPPAVRQMPSSASLPSASTHDSGADVQSTNRALAPEPPLRQPGPLRGMAAEGAPTAAPTARPHTHCHAGVSRQLLAFRGLRVRMGIHSGVPDSGHVLYNRAEARYHYSGSGMAVARAVQGAAAGGQVLLSDSTFAAVRDAREGKARRLRDAVLIHAGEHELDPKIPGAQQVYQALPRQLLCRLPLQPPLKVIRTVAAGALDAPVGRVAVAFLSVVGVSTLQAWDPDLTRRALALFQGVFGTAAAANAARGAYLVEATGGLLLAAFAKAADALATCMAVHVGLRVADWPQELLEHDMCEQVTIATPQAEGTIVREVLFRGLRVKAGVDFGPARAALNGATGRIAYRGRVMNRAARINAQGSSGQVLCSSAAWQAASDTAGGGPAARGLAALSLGPVVLKGIGEPVEILEVRPLSAMAPLLPAPPQGASTGTQGGLAPPSQPSASLTAPPNSIAAAATAAATVAAITIQPLTAPGSGPINCLNRRSVTTMSTGDNVTCSSPSSVTAAAVPVFATAAAAVGPVTVAGSPFAAGAAAQPPPSWDAIAAGGPLEAGLTPLPSGAACDSYGGGRGGGGGFATGTAPPPLPPS